MNMRAAKLFTLAAIARALASSPIDPAPALLTNVGGGATRVCANDVLATTMPERTIGNSFKVLVWMGPPSNYISDRTAE
jgi:hypothetical protein